MSLRFEDLATPVETEFAVIAHRLVKRYGDRTVLHGVDLTVRQGTVLGVLGPNGAGKTTLVRVLSTLVPADAGTATVNGFDVLRNPDRVRRSIGVTGQYASVDEQLSGFENLYLIGRLLDLSRTQARRRAGELLELFSLGDAAGRPARTCSGGMRRRLDLAAGMVGRPRVLFLDEPTTGLDPHTRNEVWEEVDALVREGTAVLLTTQYMEEAERLAHQLTVIDRGRVIAAGSVDELKAQVGGDSLCIRPFHPAALPSMVGCLRAAGIADARIEETEGQVCVPAGDENRLSSVIGALGGAGLGVAEMTSRQVSLDDVFLTLTGHRDGPDPSSPGSAPAAATAGALFRTPRPCPRRRPPRAHLRHTCSLVRRNLLHIKADPSSLLDSVLMPVLFTVLFVYVFGGAMADSRARYIQYLIPGLLGILSLILATSVSTGMNTDFQTGLMDRFRTLPIAPMSVLVARLITETVRSVVSLSILIDFAMLLGLRIPSGPLGLLAMEGLILAFGASMAWVAILVGLSMRTAQASQAVMGVVAVPLQFGSSIFAPVSTMPGWLASFTRFNPLSALADACRALLNDQPAGHAVLITTAWSVGVTLLAAPLAVLRFRGRT